VTMCGRSPRQAKAIMEQPTEGPMRWLYLMDFYSGARLSGLTALRREASAKLKGSSPSTSDRMEGRGLKNKSSRRLVPVHPQLLAAGLTADVLPVKGTGTYHTQRVKHGLPDV